MSIGPRVRESRAGIQRAESLGFRKSGLRDRFLIFDTPDTTDYPPHWSTQTLATTDIRVDPGVLARTRLGTVYGSSGHGFIRIWAAEFEDNGTFVSVDNIYGTQFHGLTMTLMTESGVVFTTKSLFPTKVEPFRVYFVGGETLSAIFSNRQGNALRFSVEIALTIEPLHRIESLLEAHI